LSALPWQISSEIIETHILHSGEHVKHILTEQMSKQKESLLTQQQKAAPFKQCAGDILMGRRFNLCNSD
jgi:hypothetical protein